MKANEVMQQTVDTLIAQIKAGAETWNMPWSNAFLVPRNATTLQPYQGGNVLACWAMQSSSRFEYSLWATYKQWSAAGAQVQRGSKGLHLIKWTPIETVDEAGAPSTKLVPRSFVVFNLAQVDGFPYAPTSQVVADEQLQQFIAAVPHRLEVGAASYSPSLDHVNMPPLTAFTEYASYFATYVHELAHWTGHRDRLARDLSGRFGSDAYAMEELIAELSAAFTCATLNVPTASRTDHAAYLGHWVRVLKAEPKVLWTVASHAQKATAFLEAFQASSLAADRGSLSPFEVASSAA